MNDTSVHSPAPVSQRRLWFGVIAPMAAWITHGMASFVIADAACSGGRIAPWSSLSLRGLQTLLIAMTLLMLAISITSGLVAWRTWKSVATHRFEDVQAWGRGEFMAVAGIFFSTIFSIGILWGGLAPLLTGLCEATR